jgi:catechol 2,3-dioxygenase-like lactoylglutathione lyase family enzyme
MRLVVNFLCRDIERQLAFYMGVLGLPEIVASRSPLFRALGNESVELGLNGPEAAGLLGLGGRTATPGCVAPITTYPTFMVDTPAQVDDACARAAALGGHIVKGPYPTYYGHWQAVLEDPEGIVFRMGAAALPAGVEAAAAPWRR